MFSGSLVAIITPMQADGSIDWPAWERLLALHVQAGTAGVVVGGTTGESVCLEDAELLQLLVHARSVLRGRAALIAGAGTPSTAATIERVRRLSTLGLDGLLVVTPAYNRPTQEGLYRHFEAVAAASSLPLVLYNVPTRTAVDLQPATVARLARVPQIVAIKEAVAVRPAERVRELIALTEGRFTVLSGDDASCVAAMEAGARGVISVTANIRPAAMAQMCAAALRGEHAEAERINAALAALHQALFVETSPIPVKWAMAEEGLIGPGIRLPLTPLSPAWHAQVRSALESARAAAPALPEAKLA
jgi:4-hydroxy-tetrahydrodipicolinate synthase